MKYYLILFIKGMGFGIANLIPGVSGGTVALITRIYEELVSSLKSFDIKALKLLISFDFRGLIKHTNLYFLLVVFTGAIVSIFCTANLFKFLFTNYPILLWSFFFGLIAVSIYSVGKRVEKWSSPNIIVLIIGCIMATSLLFISPATQNSNLFFIFICGIISVSGMLLPGLSGSFLLILMGNYELLLVTLVELNYLLLAVFFIGVVVGLLGFSHILAWFFKHYRNKTLSLLTGFILGSLSLVWPWQECLKWFNPELQKKCIESTRYLPEITNQNTFIAFALIISGIVFVRVIESFSYKETV